MINLKQKQLKNIAESVAEKVNNSVNTKNYFKEPYELLYIDDVFPEDILNYCLLQYPKINSNKWHHSNVPNIEIKSWTKWKSEFDVPDGIINIVRILNSSIILKAISNALSIYKLIPDCYFTGGGLNITPPGGLLDVHVDGNYHDATGLNRRVNSILYLNKNWEKSYGGEFGVYDNNGSNLVRKIEPIFNRLVIFNTHDKSYHGYPEKVKYPDNELRKSIILYYYTLEERNSNDIVIKEPHSALWKKYNFSDHNGQNKRKYS